MNLFKEIESDGKAIFTGLEMIKTWETSDKLGLLGEIVSVALDVATAGSAPNALRFVLSAANDLLRHVNAKEPVPFIVSATTNPTP